MATTDLMSSREDSEQAAADWLARRDSQGWSESDADAFQNWLAQSAGHRVAYYRLHAAWIDAGRVRVLSANAAAPVAVPDESTEAVEWTESVPARGKRVRYFALAASVLILLVAGLATYRDEIFVDTLRFSTVVGGLQTVPLSDGSRVTLNTDSKLSISLTSRERLVEIDRGEAFFEVAHDPRRPFIVKAGNRRVIAVGTQFSVRLEGEDVRVVVAEGTVRYEGASGVSDVVLLSAGTVAQAQQARVRLEKVPVAEAERSLTWRTGVLTFRETPLASAVAEFNRYNARKIVIEDPAIAGIEVGGVFRANNLDPFVRLLERGFDVRAQVQPDRIVLTAAPRRERRAP